jgi:hypothetical protein
MRQTAPTSPHQFRETPPISETQRTLISLCLIVHLFFVVLATTANFVASPLQSRLLDRFALYTRLLHLDRSFAAEDLEPRPFRLTTAPDYLTHAEPQDVDHRIEVLPQAANADADGEWLVLPAPGFHGGEDYQRQQRLARLMASVSEDEAVVGRLAQSIGANFARQRETPPRQVRCRRHMLQPMEAIAGGTPEQQDAWSPLFFRTVYAANVLVLDGGVQIVKIDDASQVAPPTAEGTRRDARN